MDVFGKRGDHRRPRAEKEEDVPAPEESSCEEGADQG